MHLHYYYYYYYYYYYWFRQSPGLPGWRKVNLITVTRRPLHPSIAASFYCLTTSPGFLPALCEKWSGFFYVHRVWLSYTRDRRLKVSSERLSNEDKAPCPRALLYTAGLGFEPGTSGMEVRGLNRSATTAPKFNRSFNVKGKEMGISSEYRLEYMPLMIQKKKKPGGISYSNDRMDTFIIIFFFTLDVLNYHMSQKKLQSDFPHG